MGDYPAIALPRSGLVQSALQLAGQVLPHAGRAQRARSCVLNRAAEICSIEPGNSSPNIEAEPDQLALGKRARERAVSVHHDLVWRRSGAREPLGERAAAMNIACATASSSPGVASFGTGSPSGNVTGIAPKALLSVSTRAVPEGGWVSQETLPWRTTRWPPCAAEPG